MALDPHRLSFKAGPAGTLHIYLDDYRVGYYLVPGLGRHDGVTILVTPDGAEHFLDTAYNWTYALKLILGSASIYDYQPHQVEIVKRGRRSRGGRYMLWCPTCVRRGSWCPRTYPSARAARRHGTTDHQLLSGIPAVLVDHTVALPISPIPVRVLHVLMMLAASQPPQPRCDCVLCGIAG